MSQAWVWACVVVQCIAAGASLQFGLVAATSRMQQRMRTGWSAALSVVAALTMLTGSLVVLNAGSPDLTYALTDLRSLLFTAVFLLVFPAFDQTLDGSPSRVAFAVVLVLVVVRLVLWFGTDTLDVIGLDGDGWPVYGPIGPLFALLIGVLVVSWAVLRTYQLSPQDLPIAVAASGTAIALGVTGVLNPASAVAETMSTLWIAPLVLCLQLLRRRQNVRDVAARRRTLSQQTALVELGRHIVTDDLPAAVARAEEVARHGLGHGVQLHVVVDPEPEAPAGASVVASGPVRAILDGAVQADDLPFVEGVVHLVEAVAARAQAEERSVRERLHDPVSGLPNRLFALERITQARHENAITEEHLVLQMCHLDGLEDLRTLRGYEEADRVTVRVARALEGEVSSASGWWHAGGDAFVSISPWSGSALSPEALSAMRAEVARASSGSRLPSRVRLGLGVVVARDGSTVADLLREVRAVAGMAHAHGGVEIAHHDFADQLRERVRLEQDLENAVDREEIEVHYQPIRNTGSRRVHGVEALARWRRDGRLLAPATWIPVAESSGLMNEIGAHVLRIACEDQARWGHVVAVNTSPVQLGDDRLVESVLRSARACGPENLVIEVIENALVTDLASTTARLAEMRDHGIRIALDDFGAEYSSLTRLATLPIDIIKIDRAFISAVTGREGRAVVAAVHAMSQALGKVTVAEGIETDAQLRAVQEIGCELVQGYLLGRPEPVESPTAALTPSANR